MQQIYIELLFCGYKQILQLLLLLTMVLTNLSFHHMRVRNANGYYSSLSKLLHLLTFILLLNLSILVYPKLSYPYSNLICSIRRQLNFWQIAVTRVVLFLTLIFRVHLLLILYIYISFISSRYSV